MPIEVWGGLTAENFAEDSWPNRNRINIRQILYAERFIDGVQVRVGHDYTNGFPIEELVRRIDNIAIPFVVHGPAENLGVDLGESFDEKGIFASFQSIHPEVTWREFNRQALANAAAAAAGRMSLYSRIILHPGYSPPNLQSRGNKLVYITNFLQTELASVPYSLETVPALVVTEDEKITHYGFGGVPEEMKEMLGTAVNHPGSVLLDFTHIGVTANQMQARPDLFADPLDYQTLMASFLKQGVSRFTHFSGHTAELWDVHNGFIVPQALDEYKHEVVGSALKELEKRYAPLPVVVALEINFADLESSKREVEAFREGYVK